MKNYIILALSAALSALVSGGLVYTLERPLEFATVDSGLVLEEKKTLLLYEALNAGSAEEKALVRKKAASLLKEASLALEKISEGATLLEASCVAASSLPDRTRAFREALGVDPEALKKVRESLSAGLSAKGDAP